MLIVAAVTGPYEHGSGEAWTRRRDHHIRFVVVENGSPAWCRSPRSRRPRRAPKRCSLHRARSCATARVVTAPSSICRYAVTSRGRRPVPADRRIIESAAVHEDEEAFSTGESKAGQQDVTVLDVLTRVKDVLLGDRKNMLAPPWSTAVAAAVVVATGMGHRDG